MSELPTDPSLRQMAEEIFSFTKDSWLARLAARHQGEDQLSETQFLTLDFLVGGGVPQTVGDIQRNIHVVPAQMSRIIRSLEGDFDSPLIRCELNQNDKRKIDVFLTEEGHKAHSDFLSDRLERTCRILAGIPEKDRLEFVRICSVMRTSTDKPDNS